MVTKNHFKKGDAIPTIPTDDKLRLFSMRFCPYAERIHLVLDIKSIPHHIVNINLTEKPEWLTEFSPLGKVPALGLTNEPNTPYIHESLVIADYLDAKYPQVPLYPTDPLAKAVDRLLIERFASIFPLVFKIVIGGANEDVLKEILASLDIFEAELKTRGTTFFGGIAPNMVDYMSFPFYERILALKYFIGKEDYAIKTERFPLLVQWQTAIIEDPAVKNNFIIPELHAKFLVGRQAGTPDYDLLFK